MAAKYAAGREKARNISAVAEIDVHLGVIDGG
jgi:hypothetical protein